MVHPFRSVEKGMSWVVDVVPVGEINIWSQEFGFDDQESTWVKKSMETGEFTLRMVKMFGYFAANDKVIGCGQSFGV